MTERTIIALVSAPSGFAGRTAAFGVESPFWNQVDEVNERLEQLLGVPTSVLRLVSVENGKTPAGGLVTYHVEAHGEPDRTHLHPAEEPEPDAGHRQEWARAGGPADLVAWADTQVERTGPAVQMRTWNLSSVHRLPTEQGQVWLKAVPPFFADEGTLIKTVAAHDPVLVPGLIASAPHRVLLRDEPGGSGWPLKPEYVEDVVPRWVAVQHALAVHPWCARLRYRCRTSGCRTHCCTATSTPATGGPPARSSTGPTPPGDTPCWTCAGCWKSPNPTTTT